MSASTKKGATKEGATTPATTKQGAEQGDVPSGRVKRMEEDRLDDISDGELEVGNNTQ
jgi:hypothetical protein